ILAGIVAFAVFALGGAFAWRAFDGAPERVAVSTPSLPSPVEASLQTFDTGSRILEGVTVADGSVWVMGSNGEPWNGQLLRFDPRSGDIQARIDVPDPGWEVGGAGLTSGRGSIWVAAGGSSQQDNGGAWLYRIDPATNAVADAVRIGDASPADVWVDEAGIWLLSFGGANSMTLSRIDPETYAVLTSTSIPMGWSQTVVHAGGHVWVLGRTQGDGPAETLFEIDPQTLSIVDQSQPGAKESLYLGVSGDRLWFFHDGLRALDASTGQQVVGPLDLPEQCCSASALTPDGIGGVWVFGTAASHDQAGVWHVDAAGTIDRYSGTDLGGAVDGIASAFDPATNTLWVVHYDRTVSRVAITPSPASTGSTGSVGCPSRASRWGPGTYEVHGTSSNGSLWALVFGKQPITPNQVVKIVWRMTGSGDLSLTAVSPDRTTLAPSQAPSEHTGSNWDRPGDEWGSAFALPEPGCWRIHAERSGTSGDIWLRVG
ncbi:MAG: hypothetical protein ACXVWF_04200, partial [Actinomycetota bacterium]